jgi:hypothetical protein
MQEIATCPPPSQALKISRTNQQGFLEDYYARLSSPFDGGIGVSLLLQRVRTDNA